MTVGVALLVTACASVEPPPAVRPEHRAAAPAFAFVGDTFAFPNEIRARTPARDDLYANYCFVLARAVRQFFAFARFEPGAPPLTHEGYVGRVGAIAAQAPWQPAPPADGRVVIPGYANLREFSRAEEAAVKEGLGGRFWTWVHWTNWRVAAPVTPPHVEFLVWDPNDPGEPGLITFDTELGRFLATRLYDTEPGVIRAFRMYYSWLL